MEVTLSGSSYTKLARYAGKYTLTTEKKNNRHVWVKQPGGHAIWSIKNLGWRIGSISEKDRDIDNTAFKSDSFADDPIRAEEWQFRFRNNLYKPANGIIRQLNIATLMYYYCKVDDFIHIIKRNKKIIDCFISMLQACNVC